jgi:hypothetical protein
MNFTEALTTGKKCRRESWKDKDVFVVSQWPDKDSEVNRRCLCINSPLLPCTPTEPLLTTEKRLVCWLPSREERTAGDWQLWREQ